MDRGNGTESIESRRGASGWIALAAVLGVWAVAATAGWIVASGNAERTRVALAEMSGKVAALDRLQELDSATEKEDLLRRVAEVERMVRAASLPVVSPLPAPAPLPLPAAPPMPAPTPALVATSAVPSQDPVGAPAPAVVPAAAPAIEADATPTPAPTPKRQPVEVRYRHVEFDDSVWDVTETRDLGKKLVSNRRSATERTTDGKFIRVGFAILNKTDREQTLIASPELVDRDGRRFRQIEGLPFYLPRDAETIAYSNIGSTFTRTFWAIYEVPDNSYGLKLRAHEFDMIGGLTCGIDAEP